jgi:hypothetical protein
LNSATIHIPLQLPSEKENLSGRSSSSKLQNISTLSAIRTPLDKKTSGKQHTRNNSSKHIETAVLNMEPFMTPSTMNSQSDRPTAHIVSQTSVPVKTDADTISVISSIHSSAAVFSSIPSKEMYMSPAGIQTNSVNPKHDVIDDADSKSDREPMDESTNSDEIHGKNRVPSWAKGSALEKALQSQPLDADAIFGQIQHIDLDEVFSNSHGSVASSLSHSLKSKYWQEHIQILSPRTPARSPRRQ